MISKPMKRNTDTFKFYYFYTSSNANGIFTLGCSFWSYSNITCSGTPNIPCSEKNIKIAN